jgi:amino acid permease
MKKMDKYQKMMLGFLIGIICVAVIYLFVILSGSGTGGSGSDDSSFPFFIFFPSWVAIFIPLIARQRQEEKKKEEELQNYGEV